MAYSKMGHPVYKGCVSDTRLLLASCSLPDSMSSCNLLGSKSGTDYVSRDSQELCSLEDSCRLCVMKLLRVRESLQETASLNTFCKTVCLKTAACLPVS